MPYGDPDPEDPMELAALELPGSVEDTREMARCFAEEFARMGWTLSRILKLFHTPFYVGPHRALLALGESAVRDLVAEAVFVHGVRRERPYDSPEPQPAGMQADDEPPAGPCERNV
ncbi:MAG: hypothetical protein M5U26_12905 [Planctomycetota bacterium]|nr:hypothetical protein [Planctomycetota bacterium]